MVVELPNGKVETVVSLDQCNRKCKELLGDDLYDCFQLYNKQKLIEKDMQAIDEIDRALYDIKLFSSDKDDIILTLNKLMTYFENR
ncbi:hypothetical protein [Clostridium sp. 1001283B150210_160208_E6]|uniref:hypothetical protein n=1 Tax=Clostridium sp. 1001283B150210_160208_E6 TaxID=2787129 RepID=UPI0018AB2CA9|nr:hypothetical protein [Clostridium sp. 1001283B150210_160208_E6]